MWRQLDLKSTDPNHSKNVGLKMSTGGDHAMAHRIKGNNQNIQSVIFQRAVQFYGGSFFMETSGRIKLKDLSEKNHRPTVQMSTGG